MSRLSKTVALGLMASAATWLAVPASAAPLSSPMGLQNAAAPSVETVQYRRWGPGWGWRGGGWGWRGGVAPGLIAGGIIGGALASAALPYGYYGYGGYSGYGGYDPGYASAYAPGYDYGNGAGYAYAPTYGQGYAAAPAYGPGYAAAPYGAPTDAYAAVPNGDGSSYCQQRFRSYDPSTGTYLGYDGLRHPCP
jgi:BA14K-like protein